MKLRLKSVMGLALGLACAAAGAEDLVVFQRATADGSIELTNIPADDGQYRSVATAPSARGVPGAAGAVGSANPPSAPGTLVPPGTPSPGSEEARAAATAAPPAAPAASSTDVGAPPESPLPVRGSMGQRLRALYEGARAARAAQVANGQSGW